MLNFRVKLVQHSQAVIQSLTLFWQRPVTTLLTIIVIAITLTLPLLLEVITDNLHTVMSHVQTDNKITLYLTQSITALEEQNVLAQVKNTPGVAEVIVKSASEGLAELQAQDGMQDIMQYLPSNPLPTVFQVLPRIELTSSVELAALLHTLQSYPHVEQAQLDLEWATRLENMIHLATRLTHAIMLLLAVAVILIITNTLRLMIHHRDEEIKVLKLIGAADAFVLRPFLYSGMGYSLWGAILAIICMQGFLIALNKLFNDIIAPLQMQLSITGISWQQALQIIVFALALGWFSARFTVKRYLHTIEPSG